MTSDDQIEKLIMQLIRDTSVGNVKWGLTEPHFFLSNATEDLVVAHFGTNYNGLELGIYEVRFKYWHDEDAYHWSSEIRLSVVMNGSLVVDYRNGSASLYQLFDMARAQTLDFDTLLKGSLFK